MVGYGSQGGHVVLLKALLKLLHGTKKQAGGGEGRMQAGLTAFAYVRVCVSACCV